MESLPRRRPSSRPYPLRTFCAALVVLGGALVTPLRAFPPAPHYTIYGVVRDQVGATLHVEGAQIILLRDNAEIGRAPIHSSIIIDHNYELDIRIDHHHGSSRKYSHKAVASQGVFSIAVEMNGQRFYPIEVAGTLRTGHGGERVRLDLNLGADTDGDGLPDAWEEWQLHQAGRIPGTPGWSLALIDRHGDFDGDGTSNHLEYVAGTFAGDATERFELKITGKSGSAVAFEFFGITGKVYAIEESADLKAWAPVAFTTSPGGATAQSWRATTVGARPAYVTASPGASRFYRLTVR